MKDVAEAVRRKTGRPRSFDRQEALDRAMHLFWRHGYESTALSDLTRAMGVTPPSIYAAYGDKKGLFREAVQRYLALGRALSETVARAETAREIAFTGTETPAGCLLASSTIACSAEAADLREELAGIRRAFEAGLRARIEGDIRSGELPAGTDAETLAALVSTVIQGMSTLARDGASRDKLMRVARSAMLAWPQPRT